MHMKVDRHSNKVSEGV